MIHTNMTFVKIAVEPSLTMIIFVGIAKMKTIKFRRIKKSENPKKSNVVAER